MLQGGFVWLFYGSNNFPVDERPPIPYAPELDDPTWKPVYGKRHVCSIRWFSKLGLHVVYHLSCPYDECLLIVNVPALLDGT